MSILDESIDNISWSAVIAGAIVGLGLNFLLNLLSLSIGLAIFSGDEAGKVMLSFPGLLLFLITAITAMFIAGWVTGILTPIKDGTPRWGILYGFIAWCVSLMITTILLMNMIQFAAFHSTFTSHPDLVSIKITNDKPMMTETKSDNTKSTAIADVEKKKKVININSFVTFGIFFVGAAFCSLGGYVGVKQQKDKKRKNK